MLAGEIERNGLAWEKMNLGIDSFSLAEIKNEKQPPTEWNDLINEVSFILFAAGAPSLFSSLFYKEAKTMPSFCRSSAHSLFLLALIWWMNLTAANKNEAKLNLFLIQLI